MYFLAFVFTVAVTLFGAQAAPTESCDMEEYDKCAKVAILFGDRDNVIPVNMEELDARCENLEPPVLSCWRKNLQACVKEPLTRQVLSLILQSIKRMVDLRCKDEEYRVPFVVSLDRCINSSKYLLDDCMDEFKKDVYLASEAHPDHQLALACCKYNKFAECAESKLREKENCNEKDVEVVLDLLDGYAGDTLGLMCAGYTPDSQDCKELTLPDLPVTEEVLPRSLVPLIIKILKELSNSSG